MPKSLKQEILNELTAARGHLEDLLQMGLPSCYPSSGRPDINSLEDRCLPPEKDGVETLEDIRLELEGCSRCGLCSGRNRLVFGVGNPEADLVFVGEAPGRDEDRLGEPFVGEAGRLLDRILRAMQLERSQVYICNVIKCRPPQNRDPLPQEVAACEPFLIRQLEAIRPRLIVALGKFATQSLLKSEAPISRLRGSWHEYHGVPVMPTYHPAFLLRNPASKRDVWEDMKQVVARLRQEV